MTKSDIISLLRAGGASQRLRNLVAHAIESNTFPYSKISEIPPEANEKFLFDEIRSVSGIGGKSAYEFVRIIQDYRLDHLKQNDLEPSQQRDDIPVDMHITEVLRLAGASVRLQNAIASSIEIGVMPYTKFNELLTLQDNGSFQEMMLRLKNIGKKSALEFASIIDSMRPANSKAVQPALTPLTFEGRMHAAVDWSRNKTRHEVASSPGEFYDHLIHTSLEAKEIWILRRRIIVGQKPSTLEELGKSLNVTRERIRQIQAKGIRKIEGRIKAIGSSELNQLFAEKIEAQLFGQGEYLSSKSLSSTLGNADFWLQVHVAATAGTAVDYMDQNYAYCRNLKAWRRTRDSAERQALPAAKGKIGLSEAVTKAHWPVTLSELSSLMLLSEELVLAEIQSHPKKYSVRTTNGAKQVIPKRTSNSNALRYILRRKGSPMSAIDIQKDLLAIFERDLSIQLIQSTANHLPDGLIVDRGTYDLYENFHLSKKEIESVRNICSSYLEKRQEFVSIKVMRSALAADEREKTALFRRITDYMLLGLLQDDSRFLTTRGLMVGLYSPNFAGKSESLRDEIVELLKAAGRPMSVEEIIDEFSDRRKLIAPAIISNLSNDSRVFEVRPAVFSLVKDNGGLEDGLAESLFDDWGL